MLAGIRPQNVDLRLDFLLRFHEYLKQKQFLTPGLQEADKSTKNEVETVLPDTLY